MKRSVWILAVVALCAASCAAGPAGRKVRKSEMKCETVMGAVECVGPEGAMIDFLPGPALPEIKDVKSKKDAYNKGKIEGQRLADQMREDYHRSARYVWRKALVQKTWVPRQVRNGVLVEGHEEEQIVSPGYWEYEPGDEAGEKREKDGETQPQAVPEPQPPTAEPGEGK